MVAVEILTLVPDAVETDMTAGCFEIAELDVAERARADGFAKVAGLGEVADPVEAGSSALPELLGG